MAQELHLKVKMCCLKCEEIVVEAIREVPGKQFTLQTSSSSYICYNECTAAPCQVAINVVVDEVEDFTVPLIPCTNLLVQTVAPVNPPNHPIMSVVTNLSDVGAADG